MEGVRKNENILQSLVSCVLWIILQVLWEGPSQVRNSNAIFSPPRRCCCHLMTLKIQRGNVKHLLCLCFSIFSLWTECPITNATTDEPKGLILTSLEKVHYVQNKDHEKQISSKMLTLPAISCNILCDFGTRPHF